MKTNINNAQLLADSGLKVIHVHPFMGDGQPITVAYRPQQHKGHTLEIATSVCSPNDVFCKKVGTKRAIENFLAGHTVRVPDRHREGAVLALKGLFL